LTEKWTPAAGYNVVTIQTFKGSRQQKSAKAEDAPTAGLKTE
jgi:hypothetical protein